jgi:hypothetical protein
MVSAAVVHMPSKDRLRTTARCLGSAVIVTVTAVVLVAASSSDQAKATGYWSNPTSVISPVVMASWFTARGPSGPEQLELLVLWRGTPAWFFDPGGSGGSGGGTAPYYTWITRIDGR